MEMLDDIVKEFQKGSPELQVKESRMLTRPGGGTPADRTAKATEDQVKMQMETLKALAEQLPLFKDIRDNTAKPLKVVK
ncbi:MAG: hypothetical protein ACK50J_30660 [Planctomyces sp.]